jgi:uncharacterized protein (DUF2235 family)
VLQAIDTFEDPSRARVPAGFVLASGHGEENMKRIVFCADGTWNEAERKDKRTGRPQPTNVLKVARAVLPRSRAGTDQVVNYHYGVGTAGKWDELTGGAFGTGIEQNVRALYRFLVYNYEPGDELYFFGFSRGAFTVRTLAGLMNKVGLLHKEDEYYTGEIYGLYESSTVLDSDDWKHVFRNIRDPRPSPPIRFVGVWDTVGSLGAPGALGQLFNRNKYKYHDIGLNPAIEHAYHALALDEQRKPFAPSLWTRPQGWTGTLEQVWFAGVHSNVGGSYSPDGLANEALHWMVEKAEALGLEFDSAFLRHYLPCFNSVLNDSMTPMYRVMGPYVRPVGRNSSDGEAIHQSVLDRMNLAECKYTPENIQEYTKNPNRVVVDTRRTERGKPCAPMH